MEKPHSSTTIRGLPVFNAGSGGPSQAFAGDFYILYSISQSAVLTESRMAKLFEERRAGLPVFNAGGGGTSQAFAGALLYSIYHSKALTKPRGQGRSHIPAPPQGATRIRHARRCP